MLLHVIARGKIARVDQHPVGGRQALDPGRAVAFLLEPFGELGGHRRDLPGRAPGGDHHVVGDARFALKWDRDDVLCLVLVELVENQGMNRAAVCLGGVGHVSQGDDGRKAGWFRPGWRPGAFECHR